MYIDSHTHLYDEAFDEDRDMVIERCINNNVMKLVFPNEDATTISALKMTTLRYPGYCVAAIGIHPLSVDQNYERQLDVINDELYHGAFTYKAIGEIGMDLHWSTNFAEEQEDAFRIQLHMAIDKKLPVLIHSRKAEAKIIDILSESVFAGLSGILHCWSGTVEETEAAKKLENFYFGIGGTITYKNSTIPELTKHIGLSRIVLETDAPFLPPVPYRGKRNDSSYIPLIAKKLSEVTNTSLEEVEKVTTNNCVKVLNLDLQ